MTRLKQRGGTLLGFILGMIVGLAAAMAVAIYVAGVPVPFIHKGATRSSGQDAAEAEKNKDWDPNAALRGRSPARPAGDAASDAPNAAALAEIRPAEVRPTEPPRAGASTPDRPPSSDPLGEFAAARTGATPPPPALAPATADAVTYFVQAGAFSTLADAEAQRARLSLIGVQARVSEGEQAGRTVYRVRVGPLQNKDAADRVKQRLTDADFNAALVRTPR